MREDERKGDPVVSDDDVAKLHVMDQFYHAFGKAMAAWGEVEYGLSLWFQLSTGLHYDIAKDLFFSGKSFSTRSELLGAALEPLPSSTFMPPAEKRLDNQWHAFAITGRTKAVSYNSIRNRLAHGVMHPNRGPGIEADWRLKEPAEWQSKEGYDRKQMLLIASNFRRLAHILRTSFLAQHKKEDAKPFVRALLELPNEADSAELSKKQKEALAKFAR